jgi:hypothetical protein
VRRPCQLRRASLNALFVAFGSGLCSGASAVVGYVTGGEARLFAVLCLVITTTLLVAGPVLLAPSKKKSWKHMSLLYVSGRILNGGGLARCHAP